MADIWTQIKNLFREAEQSNPNQPVIHEVIERTEQQQADFSQWEGSLIQRRLVAWLADQYAIFRVQEADIDRAIDFLDTPAAKGFVIHFHQTRYNQREIVHFFDYLKERVRALDYRVQLSDVRTYNRDQWVETVQRHYLKPRPQFDPQQRSDQKFGNILIELELRNDSVHNLRLRANTYQDRLYLPPADFSELMQAIL